MALEVEYKFLVADDSWRRIADGGERMSQGYLASGDGLSIRVRVAGERAWINIKHAACLTVRQEFEYAIPRQDADTLLRDVCRGPLVEKTRYRVVHAEHVWEVDVFHGENEGLVVAEIELGAQGEAFSRPPWVGEEVSHDPRYLNQNLAVAPFRGWSSGS